MKQKLAVAPFAPLSEERLAKLREVAKDFEIVICNDRSDAEIADCEIVFGYPDAKVLGTSKKLKWLHTQTAGVDAFLGSEANLGTDVILTNSVGAYGLSIAEHLIMVTLMILRRMGEYGRLQVASEWKSLGTTETLYGKLVTIVGLGDIGHNFATRCHSMGAKVRGVVRTPRAEMPEGVDELFIGGDELDKALHGADIVALCLPSTSETTQLFDRERLGKLKKGAIILNVGRGTAIDQDALIELLQSGHLGGAGLDVTTPEPLPADSLLWAMPNVIITPHVSNGVSLDITLDLIFDKFTEYLQDYIAGKPFKKVVDRSAGY